MSNSCNHHFVETCIACGEDRKETHQPVGCREAFKAWYWKDGVVNTDIDISENDAWAIWRAALATKQEPSQPVELSHVLQSIYYWAAHAAKADNLADAKFWAENAANHANNAILASMNVHGELKHDIEAYRGALGYSVPGDHNGQLTNGEVPKCGLCEAEDEAHTRTIDQRDKAQDAADEMTSLILGEDINWTFHDAKWREAIEMLQSAPKRV